MRFWVGFSVVLVWLMSAASALSQQPVPAAEATGVEPAPHFRVDDGVFALRPGMSIDLTDIPILAAFSGYDAKRQQVFLKLNGTTHRLRTGDRVDFMTERRLRTLTEGRARCYLDLTNVRAARGAPVTATFRLNCI